jgi:sulfite reductase alpha subunit-like flavoprotein
MVGDGTLAQLYTAFSRDGPDGEGKTYVQQRIKESGAYIWPLLAGSESKAGDGGVPPAMLYVAGSAKNMPAAVRRAIVSSEHFCIFSDIFFLV